MPILANRDEWYEEIIPITGGLATDSPPEITDKAAALDLDWFGRRVGELRKSFGRLRRTSLAGGGAVRGLYFWFRKAQPNLLIVTTTDRVFKTSDLATFTQIASGLIGTKRDIHSFATVIPTDRVLLTDGVDPVKETDGTTVTNLTVPGTVTLARIVKFFKRRTILIDVVDSGTRERVRYYWSESPVAGGYNAWALGGGAGNAEYADGGSTILNAIDFNDSLVMFKENRLGVLQATGQEAVPFSLQDFAEAPGTLFRFSPAVSPRGVLYLAYDGVRLFDGKTSILVTSQGGTKISSIAADQRDAVAGLWDGRTQRYIVSVPEPGQTDNSLIREFHFDVQRGQLDAEIYGKHMQTSALAHFFRTTPLDFSSLPATFQQVAVAFSDPEIISAWPVIVSGDYSGHVFEHEITTDDDGLAVTASITLGPFPKDPLISTHLDKRLREIRLRGRMFANTTLTVKARPIQSETWTTFPQVIDFSQGADRTTHQVDGDGISGEQFFVQLVNAQQFGSPRLTGMTLYGSHTSAFRRTGPAGA